jgi:hypothetical protein
MPRSSVIILLAASSLAVWACAPKSAKLDEPSQSGAGVSKEAMDDQYEAPPPRDTLSKVMRAKLAHAQAILEGLALSDYAMIESNALAIKRISQGGDWLVQDSATYFDFSAEFRNTCDDLVNHARAQNMQAMVSDYANLANSCVACHDYLRMERQTKDMSGRMSLRHSSIIELQAREFTHNDKPPQ